MRAYTRTNTYDKLSNVEQVSHAATGSNYNRNFSYNAGVNTLDEITSGGSTLQTFTYDNSGNQLTSGTTRKTIWNAGNMLKAYFNQSGTSEPTVYAQYLYDVGGNRIKKLIRTQGGDYETVVYINEMFIYHQKDGEGEKNEVSIKDNKSRIACIRVGDTFTGDFPESEYYILEDHLGSSNIRLKHTPGGTKIDREEFYPFGDSSLRTFDKKKYRYVGKEKDAESGLYYYGARYYAAWTCRFISIDPLANEYPFLTAYQYASNRPIVAFDLDGLEAAIPSDKFPFFNIGHLNMLSDKLANSSKDVQTVGVEYSADIGALGKAGTGIGMALDKKGDIAIFTSSHAYASGSIEGNQSVYFNAGASASAVQFELYAPVKDISGLARNNGIQLGEGFSFGGGEIRETKQDNVIGRYDIQSIGLSALPIDIESTLVNSSTSYTMSTDDFKQILFTQFAHETYMKYRLTELNSMNTKEKLPVYWVQGETNAYFEETQEGIFELVFETVSTSGSNNIGTGNISFIEKSRSGVFFKIDANGTNYSINNNEK